MAQTPQSEESGGAGETTGAGRPQGFFGGSTTILLLIFAVAVFWWSRRRRIEMEERLRSQRREAEATAERSALDVAHLMRAAPQSGVAAAAATEGLASAARMPTAPPAEPPVELTSEEETTTEGAALDRSEPPLSGDKNAAQARDIERAEARAAAERAAEEQAALASENAKIVGESAARRMAAGEAAAEEAAVDTAEAERAGSNFVSAEERAEAGKDGADRRSATRLGGNDQSVPNGAIPGDGTAICPPDYPIKGNAQSRIYHRPGQGSYASTVAEYCFASDEAAESAGFRPSRSRGQQTQP